MRAVDKLKISVAALILIGCFCAIAGYSPAFAVSADVTLRGNGNEVECDGTQRTAIVTNGAKSGTIMNKSSTSVWVDFNAGTVVTTSGSTSVEIATNVAIRIPAQCQSFNFKTTGSTSYLIFTGP